MTSMALYFEIFPGTRKQSNSNRKVPSRALIDYCLTVFLCPENFEKVDPRMVCGYFLANFLGARKIAEHILCGYFPVFWSFLVCRGHFRS